MLLFLLLHLCLPDWFVCVRTTTTRMHALLASAWSVICIGLLCFRLFGRRSSMDRGVRPSQYIPQIESVCVIMPSCWIRWCDAEFRTDLRALSGAARNKSKSQHSVQRLNSLQLEQQQSMRLARPRVRWGQLLRSCLVCL